MKYKLINITTKQETLCDKVTIDGFDYYVSDEIIGEDELFVMGNELVYNSSLITDEWCKSSQPKPIATNNPNINIPKVENEVEELAYIHYKSNKHYTTRDAHHFGLGYNKSQETHPFSAEDMIEFAKWCSLEGWECIDYADYLWDKEHKANWKTTKELFQLWQEQQPKKVYYE